MTLPSHLTLGTSGSIGRYFGVVSVVPTLLLTGYLGLLIASGAWAERPDFGRALDVLGSLGVTSVVAGHLARAAPGPRSPRPGVRDRAVQLPAQARGAKDGAR